MGKGRGREKEEAMAGSRRQAGIRQGIKRGIIEYMT